MAICSQDSVVVCSVWRHATWRYYELSVLKQCVPGLGAYHIMLIIMLYYIMLSTVGAVSVQRSCWFHCSVFRWFWPFTALARPLKPPRSYMSSSSCSSSDHRFSTNHGIHC